MSHHVASCLTVCIASVDMTAGKRMPKISILKQQFIGLWFMRRTLGNAEVENKEGPVHPGRLLREAYIDPRRLTTFEVAQALKVTRQTLSDLLNGHKAVTPEMALRISKVFGTVPEMWLVMQMEYDLAKAKEKLRGTEFEKIG